VDIAKCDESLIVTPSAQAAGPRRVRARGEEFQVGRILGAHSSGVESVLRLRASMSPTRHTCLAASIGATFDRKDGIQTGSIAA